MAEGSTAELRNELEDAIAKVRDQINAQNVSSFSFGDARSGDRLAVVALEQELAELESALANLPAED